ncbi:MAG TPA: alginate lyase family protein [Candidatus Kapabacteria bacterium]
MGAFQELQRAIGKLGISGTLSLILEKNKKKKRIASLLANHGGIATLKQFDILPPTLTPEEESVIIEKADAMLRDENFFFTFPYKTRDIEDPWNYDPLEDKRWHKKHYEETRVHTADSPKDVKIVWEINRFKDLPILAEAAFITKDKKYADEVERRLLSWIECNPFGNSVNWSSPLEFGIRVISWSVSLRLLRGAGFRIDENPAIQRSIYEHAAYLAAALSTDKIVRSNHLIGEVTGLYVVSSLFDYKGAAEHKEQAKAILQDSVLKQASTDGVSRESSGWYHGFVTDFAEVAARVAKATGDTFSSQYLSRLECMLIYKNSIFGADGIIKYGDFDNGKAIELPVKWRDAVLGVSPVTSRERKNLFNDAKHVSVKLDSNELFFRAGEFGWGGDGFSSHAHDDFLAPVVSIHRHPILVDPGTYVYNGDAENRDKFRVASYHNTVIIGDTSSAVLKPGFGWLKVRPDASIDFFTDNDDEVIAEASFGEWKGEHLRRFMLTKELFRLEDHFELRSGKPIEWHFHFHPRWRIEKLDGLKFALRDFRGHEFLFELSEGELDFEVLDYDFSGSYMEKSRAKKIRFTTILAQGAHHYRFEITRSSR